MRVGLVILGGLVLVMAGLLIHEHWWPMGRGVLVVLSDPPGAQIWVDLQPTAVVTNGTLKHLPVGRHSVTLRADSMQSDPVARVVDVRAGRTDTVRFRLLPLGALPLETEMTWREQFRLPPLPEPEEPLSLTSPAPVELRPTEEIIESLAAHTPMRGDSPTRYLPELPREAPEEISPPAANAGTVEVSTSVSGATVYVDGVAQQEPTPLVLTLPAGSHVIMVEREGYYSQPEAETVVVGPGTPAQSVYFQLAPGSDQPRRIVAVTEPFAAAIFVNGEPVGEGHAVVPCEFGTYTISFAEVEGWITPEPVRMAVTPTRPQLEISGIYLPTFHAAVEVHTRNRIHQEGGVRWSIGVYQEDEGPQPSSAQGPRVREIPGSKKLGWELGMGDPGRNPTGGDYIAFTFSLPQELSPSAPRKLRLYLYRSQKRYPLVLTGGHSELVVTINGRTFLNGYRPVHTTDTADEGRYEEWSLEGMLTAGENQIMIRTGEGNSVFNYLWKLEVL